MEPFTPIYLEEDSPLVVGKYTFQSRLILGTGKYKNPQVMRKAILASGTELVTVAIRRVSLDEKENLFTHLKDLPVQILPNTAGAKTVEEAIHIAHLGREVVGTDLVKLEIIGDEKTLYPDPVATIEAAKELLREGFTVMPYTNDDPVIAKKLVDIGCPVVMPLLAPIGSGLGIQNFYNLRVILKEIPVPVIVDAGVGVPSHACIAMEMGVDGVLMNTAIVLAEDPEKMAYGMRLAILAGRAAYLAKPMKPRFYGDPSSPQEGVPRPKNPRS
jgi:thiazole synthase